MDEYYNTGYSDVIGKGMFSRFKYKQVKACDFGLNPEDIMLLTDNELQKLVKLRRYKTYRDDEDEINVHHVRQIKKEFRKRINEEKKHLKLVMEANVSGCF